MTIALAAVSKVTRQSWFISDLLISTDTPTSGLFDGPLGLRNGGADHLRRKTFRPSANILVQFAGRVIDGQSLSMTVRDAVTAEMSADEAASAISKAIQENYAPAELQESSFIVCIAQPSGGQSALHVRQWNCTMHDLSERFYVAAGTGSLFAGEFSELDLKSLEKTSDSHQFSSIADFMQNVVMHEIGSETFSHYNFGSWYEIFDVSGGQFRDIPYSINFWSRYRDHLILDRRLVSRYIEGGLVVAEFSLNLSDAWRVLAGRFTLARDLVEERWQVRPSEVDLEQLVTQPTGFSINLVFMKEITGENIVQAIVDRRDIFKWQYPESRARVRKILLDEIMEFTAHYYQS